jgi:hypothetical protein
MRDAWRIGSRISGVRGVMRRGQRGRLEWTSTSRTGWRSPTSIDGFRQVHAARHAVTVSEAYDDLHDAAERAGVPLIELARLVLKTAGVVVARRRPKRPPGASFSWRSCRDRVGYLAGVGRRLGRRLICRSRPHARIVAQALAGRVQSARRNDVSRDVAQLAVGVLRDAHEHGECAFF